MIRIKFPGWNAKGAHESWHRATAKHPPGAVSGMRSDCNSYWYEIKLPTLH